jgi:prophage antirepressor-like protein
MVGSKCVRCIEINGEPWFCLKDLCSALGIKYPASVGKRFTSEEKRRMGIEGVGKACLSIQGLLALVPRKKEYANARKELLDLIKWYSTERLDVV